MRFLNAVSWNWRFTKGGQVGLFGYPKTLIRLKLNELTLKRKFEPLVHEQTRIIVYKHRDKETSPSKRFSQARVKFAKIPNYHSSKTRISTKSLECFEKVF